MQKPKALRMGDVIGIVAPSSPAAEDIVYGAKEHLESMGFEVKLGKSCFALRGYLAGNDSLRAEDLNNMFLDKDVQGIICLRGGYGATRILKEIDYEAIKQNPKVFVGYSDITALHIAINQICSLVTFHGPMAGSNMAEGLEYFSAKELMRAISSYEPMGLIANPDGIEIKGLVDGVAEGSIVGGNLSVIASTIGTPYEIDTEGKLLLLEEVEEEPYKIDRLLTQLALSGKLEAAAGFILGDWKDCESSTENSLSLMDVFNDIIIPFGKPTIYNLQAGHCTPKLTLPLGVRARLDGLEGTLTIEESGTIDEKRERNIN